MLDVRRLRVLRELSLQGTIRAAASSLSIALSCCETAKGVNDRAAAAARIVPWRESSRSMRSRRTSSISSA